MIRNLNRKKGVLERIKDVRRARRHDIPKIEALISGRTTSFFGNVNVGDIVTQSFITAVMEDEEHNIVGCLCVNNYPNVPSIPPWAWGAWAQRLYNLSYISPRNALWVHFAAFNFMYTSVFLYKILEYMYEKCFFVKHILLVVPPNIKATDWLEPCGTFIHPHAYTGHPGKVQRLFMTTRSDFTIYYKVRRAVVQDNDDVVQLINNHSKSLKKIYGDFYIAELILEQAYANRQVIVAEYDGIAVAVMILNGIVNYEMINHAFKLETFYGLRKPHPDDLTKVAETEPATTDGETLSMVFVPEQIERNRIPSEMTPRCSEDESSRSLSNTSRVTEDDFELPTDVAADLEIIIGHDVEGDESCDDSLSFFGTLEDQVTCVMLSYTDEEFGRWAKKNKSFDKESEQIYHPKIPVYHGDGNAFVIEVMAVKPQHESALRYLLAAAFECFPDKSYCCLCMPSTETPFPLLKLLVRVTPRPSSNFEMELYVAHRCGISSDLIVREAKKADAELLDIMCGKLKTTTIHSQFIQSVTTLDSKYSTYIFQTTKTIIGFAILSEENDIEYVNSHYQLSAWTDMNRHKVGCHGAINCFIMSPIFDKHTRFFLQELHRLSDYSILFYKIYPDDMNANQARRIACSLGVLLPVIPSSLSENETTSSESWKLPEVLKHMEDPYSLYISTPLHCGLSRTEVNTKIVVVGASDVALSFLVELIFKNNPNYRVTFNNITLVSPHGVCRQRTNKIRDILIPSRGVLHGYYLSQLSLRTYVNIVNGVMTAINRKQKTITVNNTFLPYDMLFLTCGRQYQMPQRTGKGRRAEFPDNVFIVNSEIDADVALTKLNRIISDLAVNKYTVVVYGHNMEALSCLAALLEFGIPSENLALVYPIPKDDDAYSHCLVFDDSDVEEAVFNEIKELGIAVYSGFHFVNWSFDEEKNGINAAMFESQHQLHEIECIGMFAYCDKAISMRTFLAMNRAGLVFDGGLVIGPDCQTNDPNIFAAGSITKYPRRFYADHRRHQYYNQEEIGRKLAQHISVKILNLHENIETETLYSRCTDNMKMLVPQYIDPLVVYVVLPGKLYYLNVRKPGVPIPHDIAMSGDDYGQVLLSGNCKSLNRQGYFRLHLNQGNIVETITCLAKFPIQRVNLSYLWGKHERLLNNLVQRFEMVLIPDLFAFFKEDWAYLLYHGDYKLLAEEINDIMISLTDEENCSMIEDIIAKFDEGGWKPVSFPFYFLKQLKVNFLNSEYKESIMERILSFFSDRMLYLPMYGHSLLISMILGGYEESPYFKKM
ncbi:cilia- and flagella-associated protein 61 [Holotrichia oblita]|uniref:Cilia- and flagella-associated protein 61 n=1 Tax=Holotrichia oblita TaxID=644536 RepID=A0ACB9TCB7_HOLOL|nr:cilia- and flagella-associated protein 61 [Holotrichia oblita]